MDALEFLARVVSHIPTKGQLLQRYYGWYANRTRGIRCGHEMRIVAFITQPRVIDRILTHLRRTATEPRRSRAPPRRWTSPRTTTSA